MWLSVKYYVIQRRAEQISTTRSRTCTRRKIAISFG